MEDFLLLFGVEDVKWIIGLFMIIVVSLIQKLSKNYSPWSWLLEKFGETINKKIIDSQERLEKKVDCLEEEIKLAKVVCDEKQALSARRRILRFADEMRKNEKHSLEFFDEVLNDIKIYKRYCIENPYFENDKAITSIELINEAYKKCMKNDSFL